MAKPKGARYNVQVSQLINRLTSFKSITSVERSPHGHVVVDHSLSPKSEKPADVKAHQAQLSSLMQGIADVAKSFYGENFGVHHIPGTPGKLHIITGDRATQQAFIKSNLR